MYRKKRIDKKSHFLVHNKNLKECSCEENSKNVEEKEIEPTSTSLNSRSKRIVKNKVQNIRSFIQENDEQSDYSAEEEDEEDEEDIMISNKKKGNKRLCIRIK